MPPRRSTASAAERPGRPGSGRAVGVGDPVGVGGRAGVGDEWRSRSGASGSGGESTRGSAGVTVGGVYRSGKTARNARRCPRGVRDRRPSRARPSDRTSRTMWLPTTTGDAIGGVQVASVRRRGTTATALLALLLTATALRSGRRAAGRRRCGSATTAWTAPWRSGRRAAAWPATPPRRRRSAAAVRDWRSPVDDRAHLPSSGHPLLRRGRRRAAGPGRRRRARRERLLAAAAHRRRRPVRGQPRHRVHRPGLPGLLRRAAGAARRAAGAT